jgi:hypothetical protein
MNKLKELCKSKKAQVCALAIVCVLIVWHYWPFIDAAL